MPEKNKDLFWILGFLVAFVSVLLMLIVGFGGWYPLGMMGMMGYSLGSMVLIPIAFLVVIALGVYILITGLEGAGKPAFDHGGKALEILKERYSKGEITREQFLTMKKELEE
ncbi:MAG: SHOCT domain-containing protein [Candidatus Bathyarchaeota archaeon]|nr:MAG: SHOCT domain-containing protein [Candidatus Bathyarchaeota archaeon]